MTYETELNESVKKFINKVQKSQSLHQSRGASPKRNVPSLPPLPQLPANYNIPKNVYHPANKKSPKKNLPKKSSSKSLSKKNLSKSLSKKSSPKKNLPKKTFEGKKCKKLRYAGCRNRHPGGKTEIGKRCYWDKECRNFDSIDVKSLTKKKAENYQKMRKLSK